MYVEPRDVSTFPGGRIVYSAYREDDSRIDLLEGVKKVTAYFPDGRRISTPIHPNNTFSLIVPNERGTLDNISIILEDDREMHTTAYVRISVSTVGNNSFSISTHPSVGIVPPANAHIHDPTGSIVAVMPLESDSTGRYTLSAKPPAEWKEGIYRAVVRDSDGINNEKDFIEFDLARPDLASAPTYWELKDWMQNLIQYLKYDWMGDEAPFPPAAWLTLEQYSRHWVATVEELNLIQPITNFRGIGCPPSWGQTVVKGTAMKAFQYLANRGVSAPRWTGSPIVMQDESHLQSSWEQRYSILKADYDEEKVRLKRLHMPKAMVTVDPHLGYLSGGLSGSSNMALLGRPSWFANSWLGRSIG